MSWHDLWLKFIHSVKKRCFGWMRLLPLCLCVTMGFHSFVLAQFYWWVVFSQIWVASGPLLECRALGEHWLFVPELVVLLLWLPCAGLTSVPCPCTEQLMGKLHCSTLGPHCHLFTSQVWWSLDWLSWLFSQLTGPDYPDFLLIARFCCTQWSHVKIKRQLGPFSWLLFFVWWNTDLFFPLLI